VRSGEWLVQWDRRHWRVCCRWQRFARRSVLRSDVARGRGLRERDPVSTGDTSSALKVDYVTVGDPAYAGVSGTTLPRWKPRGRSHSHFR
jgi:hypothetical protein